MPDSVPGLHHVTALCGDPQENADFYTGCLGQRLVKKTVNFDAPDTYHLYYGDRTGSPGTILTFFAFADAGPGRAGAGAASAVAYAVPDLDAWMGRLAGAAVDFDGPADRFGQRAIALDDPHGMRVELIETGGTPHGGAAHNIDGAPADEGFHSVTLCVADMEPTARVLRDVLGYAEGPEARGEDETHRMRFAVPGGGRGAALDMLVTPERSIERQGTGSIHHIAFRAETDAVQREWQERVRAAGLQVTPVIDRQYFNAIYFREPGGILFEIATDPPGFAVDEPVETLGQALKLPPQYEAQRATIERILPPVTAFA